MYLVFLNLIYELPIFVYLCFFTKYNFLNEMKYNFDEIIDRTNTNSYKWEKYAGRDILPLWVADMDFKAAPPILDAMKHITEHGILGYSQTPKELNEVVVKRLKEQHHWEIDTDWIVWLPGLVPGLHTTCRAIGEAGDEVLTVTPVYRPFMESVEYAYKKLVTVPFLVDESGYHSFDFEAIEKAITPKTKLFLICNPHNPNGRVFSKEELSKLSEICLKYNIAICSDEIHCDLILDDSKKHISIASLNKDIENQTITLLSPSKTFNIAGLGCSFAIIPNAQIRQKFMHAKYGMLPMLSWFAFEAALVAYRDCEDWRQELVNYLRENQQYLLQEINAIEGLQMKPLEATYLAWVNFSETGIKNYVEYLETKGIGVQDASIFGGKGYFRLNFATQRARLEEAIRRMK